MARTITSHSCPRLTIQGPIVRITPTEVHIDDPQFYDTIYTNSERRDKVSWHKNPYTADSAAFTTIEHDLHRLRRATLNPYFSKSQIRKFAPWIQERADMLSRRFDQEYKGTDKVVVINEAYACMSKFALILLFLRRPELRDNYAAARLMHREEYGSTLLVSPRLLV